LQVFGDVGPEDEQVNQVERRADGDERVARHCGVGPAFVRVGVPRLRAASLFV